MSGSNEGRANVSAGSQVWPSLKMALAGMGFLVAAGVLIGIMGAFDVRVGKFIVLIFLFAGVGLFQLLVGSIGLVVHSVRERNYSVLTPLVVVMVLLSSTGFVTFRYYYGTAVPGDELVPLLGKSLDDPAVQAALKRLGHSFSNDEYMRSLRYDYHRLVVRYKDDRTIRAIEFGTSSDTPYRGRYPFGLAVGDDRDAVKRKLGPPDGDAGSDYWYYPDRNHLHLVIHWGELSTARVELPPPADPAPPDAEAASTTETP